MTGADGVGSDLAADINGDGKLDLVTNGAGGLNVLLGNGDGSFQPPQSFGTTALGTLLEGDFNNDGRPDVISQVGNIITLLNQFDESFTATGVSAVGAGPQFVVAKYLGDENFAPSTSGPVSLAGTSAIQLTLSNPGPYTLNQFVTATFSCTGGAYEIVLCGGKSYPASVPATGSLTMTVPTGNPGSQTFTVSSTDAAGHISSASVPFQVLPADDQIIFSLSPVPVTYPASVTASVQIVNQNGHVPTGQVQVFDEYGNVVTTLSLSNGAASVALTGIPVGNYYYHAVYLGDSYNAGGASAQSRATVLPEAVTLSATCTSSPIKSGSSFDCSAPATAGTGTTIGYETYSLDGGATVNIALRSGVGTFTISNPSVGPHSLSINFPQQTNYLPSGPVTVNFTVAP